MLSIWTMPTFCHFGRVKPLFNSTYISCQPFCQPLIYTYHLLFFFPFICTSHSPFFFLLLYTQITSQSFLYPLVYTHHMSICFHLIYTYHLLFFPWLGICTCILFSKSFPSCYMYILFTYLIPLIYTCTYPITPLSFFFVLLNVYLFLIIIFYTHTYNISLSHLFFCHHIHVYISFG